MPVVRNPQYFFKEGFCWSDINTIFLKCRIKGKSINDVTSMSLYGILETVPEYYIICLINSKFISCYANDFLNNTSVFQINDARSTPIIIPTKTQLEEFRDLFSEAISIKKNQFSNKISESEAETELAKIQQKLDKMVVKLYKIV